MTDIQLAIATGAAIGAPLGLFAGLMRYRTLKYGTIARAWCRTAHKPLGWWKVRGRSAYGTDYRCTSCKRPFHSSDAVL